jgi:putative heme-binding domain-containing protein
VTSESKPPLDAIDEWMKRVGQGGDAERGWRVFFSNAKGKCASCHQRDGRGAGVGPDLTKLATSDADRRRILESILHPSQEVAPMYTSWKVLTTDGRAIVGLKLNGGGVGQSARYLLPDSTTVDVAMEEIEDQSASDQSIMPAGLEQLMSLQDIADLLAFLTSRPEHEVTFNE